MCPELILAVEKFVQSDLKNVDSSHDWNHICRVRSNAHKILRAEQEAGRFLTIDSLVLEVSALMHDVGDFKYTKDHTAGPRIIREFLISQFNDDISVEQIKKICQIVENVSFRHELGKELSADLHLPEELLIVQDADRLDAIGAIGIARCFAYSGAMKRSFYDPSEVMNNLTVTAEKYNLQTINGGGTAIGHFYEKLFKLKDMMKTETGRELASKRHDFMVEFINNIRFECNLDFAL